MKFNKSETLVLGVLYPGVEKYFDNYLESINSQVDEDFHLLLLNDNNTLNKNYVLPESTIWIDINKNLTPSQIRGLGIKYAQRNKYKNLIFSDVDDYFSDNRVGVLKEHLLFSDIIINEVSLFEKCEIIEENVITNLNVSEYLNILEATIDFNLFGLSNGAINVRFFDKVILPFDIIAFDWWLYTIMILEGAKASFAKDAITYYRQYSENMIGMKVLLNEPKLNLGIDVKQHQYFRLMKFCNKKGLNYEFNLFQSRFSDILYLKQGLLNTEFKNRYIEVINLNFDNIYKGWWSEILSLNEWRKYAN